MRGDRTPASSGHVDTEWATLDEAGQRDVARILDVWSVCRARHAEDGPFLLGRYCLADIFYAPVVSRFRTYGLTQIPTVVASYMDLMWAQPYIQEWVAAARAELTAGSSDRVPPE